DFIRWQDSRDRIERELWGRGFQLARVRAHRVLLSAGNTVSLEFDIETGPRTVIEVRGYEPSVDLVNAMEAEWRRSVFEAFLTEDLLRLLRRDLADEGYLRPNLKAQFLDSGDGKEKRFTVDIDIGPRSVERIIRFRGQEQVSSSRLATLVTPTRAADAWAGGDDLIEAVVGSYRAEGFLEARATQWPADFEDKNASLTIEIVEGPVFRLSEVVVEGAFRWSSTRVRSAAEVTPGTVYESDLDERVATAIQSAYHRDGFALARVRVVPEVNVSDETVTLVAQVEEGRRQLLEQVEVEGASATNPRVVAQALGLSLGDPVDPVLWSQARRRLYDTGVFRSVDITPVVSDRVTASTEGDSQAVTARVRLEEWPRYRLRYGLQLIDEQAPAGEIETRGQIGMVADVTRQNFLGRAITLGSSVRYDAMQRLARGFVLFPSFLGRRLRSNLFVSRVRETFGADGARVANDRQGLTLEQQITPREDLTLAYSYSFDRNQAVDAGIGADSSVYIARFNTSLVADRRDDLFNATRGWFHSSTFEWGAPALGSDRRFLKYVGQQNYFRRLRSGLVLASSARLGLAAGFGQELILSERFFAGGGTTVRGYPQDGIGPVDGSGHPAGGRAVIVLNQEARFPLWRMLRGVGFVDAGNVFASAVDFSFGRLRAAAGLGFRVDTPVGLFRADYGLPLSSARPDTVGQWFVSLGQAF
ncbi:MAG: BamA/TamA family outer membrane protein, partial [Acidobacteriota bacterium]|nr:BamA/TamA family outer membrane protein [Acidobacteriota bacterium]